SRVAGALWRLPEGVSAAAEMLTRGPYFRRGGFFASRGARLSQRKAGEDQLHPKTPFGTYQVSQLPPVDADCRRTIRPCRLRSGAFQPPCGGERRDHRTRPGACQLRAFADALRLGSPDTISARKRPRTRRKKPVCALVAASA